MNRHSSATCDSLVLNTPHCYVTLVVGTSFAIIILLPHASNCLFGHFSNRFVTFITCKPHHTVATVNSSVSFFQSLATCSRLLVPNHP